jgi:hypothetical protein
VAVVCAERRLVNIVGVHPHLMVATTEVELGEERGALDTTGIGNLSRMVFMLRVR